MSNEKKLESTFRLELLANGESRDDVICMSHPWHILEKFSTLEEIQCCYVNSGYPYQNEETAENELGISQIVHKQDMPFIAITEKYIYCTVGYTEEITSYRRDDQ